MLLLSLLSSGFQGTAAQPPATSEASFLSNPRQLIFEGKRSGEGYFSPDGKALIFQSEREPGNPFYQIYLLDLESGDSHRVSPGIGKTTCAFFRPGSDEVLFASTHLDPEAKARQQAELDFRASGKQRRYSWDYDEHMDIFAAQRDGTNIKRLTSTPGYDAEGDYSPDGKFIVFCSLRDAYPTNKLSPEDLKRLETDPAWFDGRQWIEPTPPHPLARLRWRPVFLTRRATHPLAPFRRQRRERGCVHHEARRIERETPYRLWCDVLGAVFPSDRRLFHLHREQTRLFELRAVHRRFNRHEGAGARDVHRRLRRAAGLFTRWKEAVLDLGPDARREVSTFHGGLEPHRGARGAGSSASARPRISYQAR
jgi:hypothetical protein